MKKQSHVYLMILCAVLSQGISVSLDEKIEESSDVHIRRKRVVNLRKQGDGPVDIRSVPYVVNIQKDNISECAGTILSAALVLTSYYCIYTANIKRYTILSGSSFRNNGTLHTISKRIIVGPCQDLALAAVSPNIDFHESPNRPISLFAGAIPDPVYGTFSGWGCTHPGSTYAHTPNYPEGIMQVRLPIIPLAQCIDHFAGRITITDKNICTLDPTFRRGTCIGDLGSPLVLKVPPLYNHQLLGVMSTLRARRFGKDPDVFINLNHFVIHQWIADAIEQNN